jgi:hypothetical protein
MPRPRIKLPPNYKANKRLGKSGPPTVAPPPKKREKPEVTRAKEMVAKFEQEHEVLKSMRAEWEVNFEKANRALREVKTQQDHVEDLIKKAKPLVAKAKMTIGPFKAQRKWQAAGYNDAKLTNLISNAEDWDLLVGALLNSGLIEVISVDNDAMTSWCAQNPEWAERFLEAWEDAKEKTTAVTVPTI